MELDKLLNEKWKIINEKFKNKKFIHFDNTIYNTFIDPNTKKCFGKISGHNIWNGLNERDWNLNNYIEINTLSDTFINKFDIERLCNYGLIEPIYDDQNGRRDSFPLSIRKQNGHSELTIESAGMDNYNKSFCVNVEELSQDNIKKEYQIYYLKLTPFGANYHKNVILSYVKWILPIVISFLTSIAAIIVACVKN